MPGFARAQIVDQFVRWTPTGHPRWQRYGLPLVLAATGVAVGLALGPSPGTVTALLLALGAAVALSAWFGGLGPGLLATVLGTVLTALFAAASGASLAAPGLMARHVTLLLTGGAVSLLGEVLHEARRQADQGVARVKRLAELQVQLDDVAIALAEALQVPQVAEIAVVQGCALLGASAGTLAVLDAASGRLRPLYTVGYPPEAEADRVVEIHSDEPLAEAVRGLAPVVIESRRVSDARYPHLAPLRNLTGTEAVAALPLIVQGRVLGGVGFSFREPRRFHRTDLPLLQALAYQAALALESARRYGKEHEARQRAEASGARHRFAAEANAGLAASMDYRANLREVAHLSVPAFSDGCLVHLSSGDGGLGLLAAFHAEEALGAALADLGGRQTEQQGESGFWHAFHAGRPELITEAAGPWAARARDEREAELLEQLGLGSSLSVPLLARARALGLITFVTSRQRKPLGDEDLRLALELADRAASAVDNALLFEEAQRLNRVKDEFLALLSHELRTPLGSVLVWLELLRAEPLEAEASRAAQMIHRSARQLTELIDQLLDVSRIVAGKLSVEKQAVDLARLVEGVVETAAPVAEAKGLRLQADLDRELERLWADPNRLRQALTNLILNAVKFTPAGGAVGVRLQRVDGLARIEVRDTGVGIARDLLPFIFEPFRQGDTHSTRAHGGLGLGLALAQHVAEQHEGRIRAASEGPGMGAVFTLDLPMRGLPAQVVSVTDTGALGASTSLGALRVLLVDDHEETLHGLALVLSANGAEVTPVSSASEALRELPRLQPHVLVSDLAMPGQDGYSLISEIRSLTPEAGGRIPAVAVSAYASPDDRLRALRAGYHEHVAKPVEIRQLVRTIARLANRREA